MQRNGIRLQQAGKKIGRDCHPARRDDDRQFSLSAVKRGSSDSGYGG
jgi:hypothetical protein